ncbi:outer membrane protein assembly factor BamB family protein [Cellulophaga tyrosinoxydans]|uniref:Outer membrane protein assembly factor BamB, contains PQQ-like beta-propeller repeat n=1 Tax=Cellulophaga tyrosinoxydans TaxID=504486 RepID=A0A1W2BHT1_9FLAO|nr:PQQ-binding-like beta-propeller repeat protein [Cellulophaga tyrosinoxydans]SMC72467.1 Outer membrane protein assembly factor BamB, contains PQQ-like beta-propeller repeat [Cellulophaga tyrosinoxydans]
MKTIKLIIVIILSTFTFFSCSKDDSAIDDNSITPDNIKIVSGDPSLNNFIMTTWDESIVKVDAQTGKEDIIYTLPEYTYGASLPDYSNGILYFASDDNSVNAVNIGTKTFLWDKPMLQYHDALGISNTTCKDGICYTSGGYGVVVALEEGSGTLKWYYTTDLNGELDNVLNEATTPIVYKDKIYIFSEADFLGDFPAYMHILNKETGSLISKIELPYDISSVPLIENDILYLPAKNMFAIDLNNFNVLWEFEAEGVSSPQVTANRVVFQGVPKDDTISSALFCINKQSGSLIWANDTGFDRIWTPIVVEDVVFGVYENAKTVAFSTNGRPFAARLSDGKQIWFRDSVVNDTPLVYANGMLYFHGHDINRTNDTRQNVGLIAMNANNGEVVWLNTIFGYDYANTPIVIAQNGVFGPGYYR